MADDARPEPPAAALTRRAPGPAICARLNVSRVTLWRWRRFPDFPPVVAVGRLRLYDVDALEAWLRAREGA